MKILLIYLSVLFLTIVSTKLSAQIVNDTIIIGKAKIDSIVRIINASYDPKFAVAILEGKDRYGDFKATISFKPESDVFQKIILDYKDTTLNRNVFYSKDVMLRIDFKDKRYYNIFGKIVDQNGKLPEGTISDELINFGTKLIRMVKSVL